MQQMIADLFGPTGTFSYWQVIAFVILIILIIVWVVVRRKQ